MADMEEISKLYPNAYKMFLDEYINDGEFMRLDIFFRGCTMRDLHIFFGRKDIVLNDVAEAFEVLEDKISKARQ